jgi:hypothetical protein
LRSLHAARSAGRRAASRGPNPRSAAETGWLESLATSGGPAARPPCTSSAVTSAAERPPSCSA